MAITSKVINATETTRLANITHKDDAASPAEASYRLGFDPRYVCLENIDDGEKFEWHRGMDKDGYIHTQGTGSRALDYALVPFVDGDRVRFSVLQGRTYHVLAIG